MDSQHCISGAEDYNRSSDIPSLLLTTQLPFLVVLVCLHAVKTHVKNMTHSEQEQELLPSKSGVGGEV